MKPEVGGSEASQLTQDPSQIGREVVRVKLPCRGVLGNQDHVPACRHPAVLAQPLSQQAPDPVSNDRVPHFLGDRDPEPARQVGLRSFACDREDVATVQLRTRSLDGEVVGALSQPVLLGDPKGRPASHVTSSRPLPRSACDPSRGGDGAPRAHPGSSYVRGSRACACGSCCAVGTYASRLLSTGRGDYGGRSILKRAREVKAEAARVARSCVLRRKI